MNEPYYKTHDVTSLDWVKLSETSQRLDFTLVFESGLENGFIRLNGSGNGERVPAISCAVPFLDVDLSQLEVKVTSGTMKLSVLGMATG